MDWLNDFKKLLSFASVSSEPEYKNDMEACFDWVKAQVEAIGFETEVWKEGGHPTLFGSWEKAPGKPTLLLYNHYDVQPIDPLSEWATPPFDPQVRENQIFARGAQDNKGQLFYTLLALKDLWKNAEAYPLNIKWLIEGEEEVGSKTLPTILNKNQKKLKADYLAVIDGGIPDMNTPAVTLGMRGIVTLDVVAKGTEHDLHSGAHGGLAYNPVIALAQILAAAKDPSGKISIPGFYDSIEPLTDDEKTFLDFSFDEKEYEETFGASATGGEVTFTLKERNWLRPTFEVNGFSGGYTGDGFKTVIPSEAKAKISCRLVRGQNPEAIGKLVCEWLASQAPKGISVQAHLHPGGGEAVLTSPETKIVKAFSKAYEEVFQKPCSKVLEGASIPIVPDLQKASGAEPLLVGLGLNTDHIHAPNERFGLDRVEMGRLLIKKAIEHLSR
ncbi:MAG: M20/M25/M40 family metallo-hydrolase [Chlamydiia bacterium]|nr:M20/M25/M40 family metallo-hydrolase [Chlamydiia bacterium]